MDIFLQALPAIISGASLAVVSWIASKMKKLVGDFATLKNSQRNQLKASIVNKYEEVTGRGYITPLELESVNRMADSYFDLDGNHYIHSIIKHLNEDFEIKGEPIPE